MEMKMLKHFRDDSAVAVAALSIVLASCGASNAPSRDVEVRQSVAPPRSAPSAASPGPAQAPEVELFALPAAEDPAPYLLRCERGDMEGCRMAGWLFLHGFGVVEDGHRADDLYVKACQGKNTRACMEFAAEYYHWHDWPSKAMEFVAEAAQHELACNHGDQQGCLALALDVLRHPDELKNYRDGIGKTAQKTAEDACAASNVAACSTLMGIAQLSGDKPRAEALGAKLLALCDAGEMSACWPVLGYPWKDKTPAERSRLTKELGLKLCKFSQAECRAGRGARCSWAMGCVDKNGFDPQGPEAVAEFTYRACVVDREFKRCEELAGLFERGKGVPKDPEKAAFFDMAACQHGRELACWNTVLRLKKQGSGPEVDKKIFEVTKMGCRIDDRDVGWLRSCERLAGMYETGTGTQKDVEKAVELFTAVCPYREESCDNLRRLKRPVPPDADAP
ncbi:hypothetical protein WME75_01745 [Sorangium sp. So ce1014]|uniref:tetratricopeptide repeat protein n=1 Tax=Sorangium sp. So ce1014 TaxID=3133326 RepID=UPI003F60D6D7